MNSPKVKLTLAGVVSIALLAGCSGSSDSGVDVASLAGNYRVTLNNVLYPTNSPTQYYYGTMKVTAARAVTIDMDVPWSDLSGSINDQGCVTVTGNTLNGVYQGDDTWTGCITGSGTDKKVTNGKWTFQFQNGPIAEEKWTAQCTQGC
jgi:hypothetical protein